MRPPILGLFPKVVPEGGYEHNGQFLPAGTDVCVNMASLLRSTELFGADADVFRPERFLVDEEKRKQMQQSVDLVFGYGQHLCLGKHIAFMELYKVTFEVCNNRC